MPPGEHIIWKGTELVMVEIVVSFTEHEQLITQHTAQRVADMTLALSTVHTLTWVSGENS